MSRLQNIYEFIISKHFLKTIICLCIALSYIESVRSDDSSSFFIGGGLGLSFLQPKTNNISVTIPNGTDLAFNLLAGYSYNENWSGEVFWAYLGQSIINSNATNLEIGNITQQSFGASGTFHYPFNKEWDVLATAGVGVMSNEINLMGGIGTSNDTFFQVGVGAGWKFADTWELRTKYDYYNETAQMLSFNVVKQLGAKSEKIVPTFIKHRTCDSFYEKFDGITFAQSSTDLTETAKDKLDSLAINLLQLPIDISFELRAYADDVGTELFNYQLSSVRAQIVRDYLSLNGIALSRMTAMGYGEWQADKNTNSAFVQANNRRVELVLVGVEKYVKDISSCH